MKDRASAKTKRAALRGKGPKSSGKAAQKGPVSSGGGNRVRNAWTTGSLAAGLLLAVLALQGYLFIRATSQTSDEAIHLAAGYSYLKLNDFRLNPEHPPLVKELAALPLLFLNLRYPAGKDWDQADQVEVGLSFVHRQQDLVREQSGKAGPYVSNDEILSVARLPVLLLSLGLGWALFCWGRELFGVPAALLALALYVLDPNVITHSCLVTTDLGVALFIFLTLYALWKYVTKPRPMGILWFGLAAGAAFASKFTALWLLPVLGLIALYLVFSHLPLPARPWSGSSGPSSGRIRRLGSVAAVFGFAALIGVLFLLVPYFFVHGLRFFDGLSAGMKHSEAGHLSFLLGSFSVHGWWYYFPVAFAVKSPPGTLVLLAISAVAFLPLYWCGIRAERIAKGMFVILPPAVILVITAFWRVNIGLRHILPVYPFLFLYIGSLAERKKSARWLSGAFILLCLVWNGVEAARIAPYDLAYFNPFAGGPRIGTRYLSDSNIDWGQSAKALKKYLDSRGLPAMYCAFGLDTDPWYYGLKYQYVPGVLNIPRPGMREFLVPEEAPRQLLAVSAMVLQGLYLPDPQTYSWLKSRTPIADVGYEYFIYDITGDDMAHVRIAYNCYQNHLYYLAAVEARRALKINPDNAYARRLIAMIDPAMLERPVSSDKGPSS